MPGGAFVSENVKITLLTQRETVTTIYTDNQGQFEFPGLLPGNYKLEVEADRQRFEVTTEAVQVFRGTPSIVNPALKEKQLSNEPGRGKSISVSELSRNVPSAAKKEFDKANHASNEGRTEEAIAHLRKAVALFPDFTMALSDLGSQLLGQGKLDQAAEVLSKAINLDDKAFNPALNLGIVRVHQNRFSEAAQILTRALSLEPNSPAARLYAGITALALGTPEVAEKELKAAYELGGSQYALALFHLGQLYMNKGDRNLALKSFEHYLSDSPNAANADQVRKLISMLRQ